MQCGYDKNGIYTCQGEGASNVSDFNSVADLNKFVSQNPAQNTFNSSGQMNPMTTPVMQTSQEQKPQSWFSNMFGSNQNQDSLAYNPNWGISEDSWNSMNNLDKQKFKINQDNIEGMNDFDWQGALDSGIAGANFLMDLGMYSPRKGYLESSAKALNQNIDLAKEQWDEKKKVRQNYGSAFSNN